MNKNAGRVLPFVIVVGIAAALFAWWWVGGPRGAEPRTQPRAGRAMDGAVRSLDAGIAPLGDGGGRDMGRSRRGSGSGDPQQDQSTVGRLDGAVQLHLPPPPEYLNPSVTTPAELRQRRIEQIGTIGTRIERLNDEIARGSSNRALLEVRRDRLLRRREQLTQALLDEPAPSP